VPCGGILLTGGRSSRFGRDKATTPWDHRSLAQRAAEALVAATDPAIEVGPGGSGLPHVEDRQEGPLAALAAGVARLTPGSSALLLACDLPLVEAGLLRWLVEHPWPGSVVPLAGVPPRAQPLCARWSAATLSTVALLLEDGERSLRPLVAAADVTLVGSHAWIPVAGPAGAAALDDTDTPAELERLRELISGHRRP
jgi:molybdenum cofactor guanylyltransferase